MGAQVKGKGMYEKPQRGLEKGLCGGFWRSETQS